MTLKQYRYPCTYKHGRCKLIAMVGIKAYDLAALFTMHCLVAEGFAYQQDGAAH
jgi:hypothetical protein